MGVDWQQEMFQIRDRGLHLLQTATWADCRFLVGTAPPNQKIIAGHKLILAMASPVFERMFYGQLADKDDPIVIPDVQPDVFHVMMEYIYADKIYIATFDKACELYYVAKKYMLPHIVEHCTRFLVSALNASNACRAYEFAKLFDDAQLMGSSMALIARHTKEVLADPGFTDIEMPTLMAILDQDELNINSELDLFNALLRFANERSVYGNDTVNRTQHTDRISAEPLGAEVSLEVEEIKVEPDVNNQISSDVEVLDNDISVVDVPENIVVTTTSDMASVAYPQTPTSSTSIIKVAGPTAVTFSVSLDQLSTSASQTNTDSTTNDLMETPHAIIDEEMLKKAVKKIRFLTMTAQQFAEGPAHSKILEPHEALGILVKILSLDTNNCPMPEGFCDSRCSRYKKYEYDSYTTNSFCIRQPDCCSTYIIHSIEDESLTFEVKKNICIEGVEVPTQIPRDGRRLENRYNESLYVLIQTEYGQRVGITHYTSLVAYNSTLKILFDRSVWLNTDCTYKLSVIFNKAGCYPKSEPVARYVKNNIHFKFINCINNGVTRAILFSTQDSSLK